MREIEEYERALAVAPYGDDATIGRTTRAVMERGHAIFQVHRLGESDGEHIAQLLAYLLPSHGTRILDVGCGVGSVARHICRLRSDLDITLLNVSREQLALCPPELKRVCAGAHDLPFADASFDVVMFLYSLGHALVDVALKEAARMLKPGGCLFIYDIAAEDTGPLIEGLGYVAHPVARVLAAARTWGYELRLFDIPVTSTASFQDLIGPAAFAALFAGVRPVIYRFTRA